MLRVRPKELVVAHLRKNNLLAWLHALPIILIVLSLFYYWFAIANRYIVFLYYHDMGTRFPDTSPFSDVTRSRYWMTGLVTGGVVMVCYMAGNWLLGRFVMNFRPPAWWLVWAWSAIPLLMGIPLITMTTNQPVLPPLDAARTTLAALVGVGLGLMPGRLAAKRPGDLVWLTLDGVATMFLLLFTARLGDVTLWWTTGSTGYIWIVGIGIIVGVAGLLFVTALRVWRHTTMPGAGAMFIAGLSVTYLLLPLVHYVYVGITDSYYYISTASNFFARSVPLQIVTWFVVAAIVLGITRIRERLL